MGNFLCCPNKLIYDTTTERNEGNEKGPSNTIDNKKDNKGGVRKSIISNTNFENPKKYYEFLNEKLGSGGFGQVIIAKHKNTKKEYAIKIINRENLGSCRYNSKIQEVDILKRLDHSNILKLSEFYETSENFYLVTEYVHGTNLLNYLNSINRSFTEIEAGLVMFQVLSAIAYCNKYCIMHRDLKPENIIIEKQTKNGMIHAKVIDFGEAQVFKGGVIYENLAGTFPYMAPEVFDRKTCIKSDMWSLGVVMYQMLMKKNPYELTEKDENKQPKFPKDNFHVPSLIYASKEANDLFKSLLTIDPEKRISAEKALNSKWFTINHIREKLEKISLESMNSLLENIKNYHPQKMMQKAAIAYLIHNFQDLKEIKEARSLFLKLDSNNDGHISKKEFCDGLIKLCNEYKDSKTTDELNELFEIIDADHSDDIEFEEFVRAATDKNFILKEENLKFAFNFFDRGKNQKVSLENIKDVFHRNVNFKEEDFMNMIKEVDLNGDGFIDYSEFCKMMKLFLDESEPNRTL